MAIDITTIGIGVDSRQVKTAAGDLDKLGKSGESAAKGADAVTAKYRQMGMIVGAAMAGAAVALGAFVKSQINAADAASKTAQQIGVNIKSLTALQHAADLSGVSHQSLADSLAKFNRSISEASQLSKSASQAFADLGVNINDSNGTLKTTETLLLEVADQFAKYENSATKTAMAQELFGRSGAALIPLLNQGSKGIQDMMKQAELLGLVIDQKTATAAENFNDSLSVLQAATVGIARQVVAELAPAMNEIAGVFVEVATETSLAEMAARGLAVAFKAVITVALAVGTAFTYAGERIGAVAAAFVLAARGDFALAWEVIKQNSQDSSDTIAKGIERISKLWAGDYAESGASAIALHQTLTRTQEEGATATKKLTEEQQRYQQVLANRESAELEIQDLNIINHLLQQGLDIETARFHVEAARKGLLPEQIEMLMQARDVQKDLLEIETARQARLQVWIDNQKKLYDEELKRIEEVKKANKKASEDYLKEVEKANDKIQKDFEKTADSIRQSLTDALMRGFEDGKSFAKNFIDTLINMFKTLVLRPTIEFILAPISGAISGVISSIFGGGALGGTSGLGSIFTQGKNILTGIKDGFTGLNNSLTSAIGDLGTFLSTGNGGLGDVLGGFIGQYSTQIANVLPYAGAALALISGDVKGAAFQGAGVAIGSALGGPIGGAIGGALGSIVGGLFGGKDIPMTGDQAKTYYDAGQITSKTSTFGKSSLGGKDALTQANEAFARTYGALITQFDENAKFSIDTIYRSRTNKQGFFRFNLNGKEIQGGGSWLPKGISFEKFIKTFTGEGLVKVIKKSTAIPQAIRDLFDGMTKFEEVNAMVGAVINLQSAQEQLTERFGLTTDAAAGVAKATGYMGDELVNFINKLSAAGGSLKKISTSILDVRDSINKSLNEIYGTITTTTGTAQVTEKVPVYSSYTVMGHTIQMLSGYTTITKTITTLVDTLVLANVEMPKTVDEFDKLLKSINTTTLAGQQMFAAMFELRDSFIAYQNAIDGLKAGVNQAIYAMLSPAEQLAENQKALAEMFATLNMAMPTSIEQLIALGKSIDYGTEAGLDLAMAFPILVQAFMQVEESAKQAEQGVTELASKLGLLNENNFKNVIDFNRAQAYMSNGIPLSMLPSYDVGTSYVPKDGPAMLHKGEAVLTASENRSRSSEGVVAEIRALRYEISELKRSSAETARNTKRTSDTLINVSRGGDSLFTEAA